MIVFHHNDADGRCAAAVVNQWFSKSVSDGSISDDFIIFRELDYKDAVPIDDISRNDTVIIVDFSFKPDVMSEVIAATDRRVIWCDHHATAKNYNYDLPGVRDFSDKGSAGCEVTWKYFFPDTPIPSFVTLLGDYDSWRLETAPRCFEFYEGLKLFNQSPDGRLWLKLFMCQEFEDDVVSRGSTAIMYRDNYCEEMRSSFGYATEIDEVKAYATNIYRFGSQGFGDKMQQYPVCICFAYDGKQFTVSLYSETIDVSAIAKKFGGGGHKGAAGFVCRNLPFIRTDTIMPQ